MREFSTLGTALPLQLDEALDVLERRARVWAATAGGPRDVVVVVDVSGGSHYRSRRRTASVDRLQLRPELRSHCRADNLLATVNNGKARRPDWSRHRATVRESEELLKGTLQEAAVVLLAVEVAFRPQP